MSGLSPTSVVADCEVAVMDSLGSQAEEEAVP